ncbi:MAG: oxaloacetate-decarboxylating malate dehydrogenase, partial [Gammaproteobacteria bacterium]|nr:oxaloacetate-decarboxylating malate dehydrogenase [Gammaproteobacteria bacterium]
EFLHPAGAYIAYPDRKNIKKILDNVITNEIDIIVVTDGERVLGIGDQGIGGIGISIGKLMLYTLLGGIDPKRTLPIVLDVGTNNKKLLNDPNYLGWRNTRITGDSYLSFIDKFISALKKKLPNVLLQWEDFGKDNAWGLLELYRNKICSFNDDIQGTATVTLAAILAAVKTSKQKLAEQRIVIFGAGSAAIGIVKILAAYLKQQGVKEQNVLKNIWLVDKDGLITDQLKNITKIQQPYAHNLSEIKTWKMRNHKNISLLEVIQNVKPTILLGYSTVAGAFTEKVIKEMAQHVDRPIIFPLSNPTANCEATPTNLIKWTKGKALIATGSPFEPVIYKNRKFTIAQCNNALVFPGIGLGVIASKARKMPDEIFLHAAEVLYKKSPALKNPKAPLLPPINDIPKISKLIAIKVAKVAIKSGLSTVNKKTNISSRINQTIWRPQYEK